MSATILRQFSGLRHVLIMVLNFSFSILLRKSVFTIFNNLQFLVTGFAKSSLKFLKIPEKYSRAKPHYVFLYELDLLNTIPECHQPDFADQE